MNMLKFIVVIISVVLVFGGIFLCMGKRFQKKRLAKSLGIFLSVIAVILTVLVLTYKNGKNITEENCFDNENVDFSKSDAIRLSDNEKISEACWVEDGVLYRVSIDYIDTPFDQYSRKTDWFFYVFEDGGVASFPIFYTTDSSPKKGQHQVFSACDFNVELKDVNFDGLKDILIGLGHAGAHGDVVCCAYINCGEEFIADYSFEKIPNYELDADKEVVLGQYMDAYETVNQVYKYDFELKEFVLISEERVKY